MKSMANALKSYLSGTTDKILKEGLKLNSETIEDITHNQVDVEL